IGRWNRVMLYTAALGHPPANPDILQMPYRPGVDDSAPWVAIAKPDRALAGKTSLLLHRFVQPATDVAWSGMLLDEWTGVVPEVEQRLAVGFHYDNAGAEAPQTILLAVPPVIGAQWNSAALLAILQESLTLAKVRAVDLELLAGLPDPYGNLAQVIPPICI